jgi:hypothetical protein
MFDDARGAVPELLSALAKASLILLLPRNFLISRPDFYFTAPGLAQL